PPPPAADPHTLSLPAALPISISATRSQARDGSTAASSARRAATRSRSDSPIPSSGGPADPGHVRAPPAAALAGPDPEDRGREAQDRKSTRLNSSHLGISYAVF